VALSHAAALTTITLYAEPAAALNLAFLHAIWNFVVRPKSYALIWRHLGRRSIPSRPTKWCADH